MRFITGASFTSSVDVRLRLERATPKSAHALLVDIPRAVATFTWSRRARGLTTFCVHLFQHLDGEQLLGDELLQLRVLGDERLHLLDLVDGLAAAALPLDVQRLLGDAELLRDLVVVTGVLPAGCRTTFSIRFQSRVARAQAT
jgi:hypothetical protein